jgi:hypothetical protein
VASTPQIPNFDANAVREGLRLAMQVGLPPDTDDQPLFVMPTTVSGDSVNALDAAGTPFKANYRPARTAPVTKRVPCAIEYFDGAGKIESFGLVAPSHVLLTLLDQDFAQVKGFSYVVIGGNKYWYERELVPLGLVDVGVHQVKCASDDEG